MHSGNLVARMAIVLLTGVVSGSLVTAAQASGLGPRLGLTSDPDQIHVGVHVHAAQMAPRLSFLPSFEVGLGNDVRLFAANMDFKYSFPLTRTTSWRPYLGAGPAIHVLDRDNVDDNMDVGLSFFGGLQTGRIHNSFFGEMRLGLVDSPDFKFTIGWMFR